MTLSVWFRITKKSPKGKIVYIKTDDGNALTIGITKNNKLCIKCVHKGSKCKFWLNLEKAECDVELCDLLEGPMNFLSFELFPVSEGLFKAADYQLSVNFPFNTGQTKWISFQKCEGRPS